MGLLIDAHMHLFPSVRSSYVDEVVEFLRARGNRVIAVSIDVSSSIETLRIGRSFPSQIIPFIGVHPASASTERVSSFEQMVNDETGILGIGEIGLDGTYSTDAVTVEKQRIVFDQMLSIAERLNKPVSVHSRGAVTETLLAIRRFSLNRVMLHWFAGTESQLKEAQEMGFMVSFGPASVYSRKIQRLAKISNPEMTLVESDAPVRFSACFGGHAADPRMVGSVVNTLARIWEISYNEVAALISKNTLRYLKTL